MRNWASDVAYEHEPGVERLHLERTTQRQPIILGDDARVVRAPSHEPPDQAQ
jgi:hypothetical protein